MKLSTAMMLGSTTCRMEPGEWNTCALGAAANAVGLCPVFSTTLFGQPVDCTNVRIDQLNKTWPWLELSLADEPVDEESKGNEIWRLFDEEVCDGTMTFEQLVDYVSKIEPHCGSCNRYDCRCVQKMDSQNAPQTEAVTTASF